MDNVGCDADCIGRFGKSISFRQKAAGFANTFWVLVCSFVPHACDYANRFCACPVLSAYA